MTIAPWNSSPDFLNQPISHITSLFFLFRARDHCGLDGDLKAGGDRRRTRLRSSAADDGGGKTCLAMAKSGEESLTAAIAL
ncbi:hypothetical protein [Bradyrhizobium sp. 76]|uniref:hypothetical protein n=1 Tax=Bradyrhizobium sp. 76 TaxID=2782680 RepID=UPI001FF9B2B4|nr:hypothetical protein [Bradyrhizobium sp. 76]MCK1406143.1 hypothetical protein [Bradyrhizobium sp. 76]